MSRLSKDQKRRKKLTERSWRRPAPDILPYDGKKYEKPEYVEALFQAECAILEGFEVSGRRITDRDVKESLEYLIALLRGQNAPEPPDAFRINTPGGRSDDFIAVRIQENWDNLFRHQDRPHSRSDLAGILRKILHSLNLHTSLTPGTQRYLLFLVKFLAKMRVRYRLVKSSPLPQPVSSQLPGSEEEGEPNDPAGKKS